MLPQSKPCVCGMTIPKEWPICVDCRVKRDEVYRQHTLYGSPTTLRHAQAIILAATYAPEKERLENEVMRNSLVAQVLKKRGQTAKVQAIGASTELQQEIFLMTRKLRRQAEAKRVPQALKDWYANGA